MKATRRDFVIGAASLAAMSVRASAAGRRPHMRPRVGVIGGGIIGASVALQLARAGADVLVFEKEAPAAGATRASVAWINPVVNDPDYMRLRLESMRAWHEDDRALGMNAIWGGSISWAYASKEQALRAKAAVLQQTDDPPHVLTSRQITEISPGVHAGDDVAFAFETHRDGHVDPVHATGRYLAAARALGAKILYPCDVGGVVVSSGRMTHVETSRGRFALDHLVSVAGVDTPRIMAMMGRTLELAHKPGLVVHTDARPIVTDKVFEASSLFEFKQYADGRFLTSLTGGPPDLPVHAAIRQQRLPFPGDDLRRRHGQMLIEQTARYLPAIASARPEQVLLGFRPYPLDNRPICGPVPGVEGAYVVVTHSGITLAPILGRYVAQEIMRKTPAASLTPYRPNRYINI